MPDLIYNVKFQIDDSQFQSESAGVERYKQEIEEAKAEIAELKSELDSASNSSKKFSGTAKNVQGSTKRMNASFSSANQALFSFSDLTQDAAQFQQGFGTGMRAIGNNVGFTAELMGNLNARVKEHNASLIAQVRARKMSAAAARAQSKTLKGELLASLRGPGGLLIGINAAVLAVTVLSNAFDKNKRKAEEAAEGISQYSNAIQTLRGLATPDVTQLEGLVREEAELESIISLIERRKQIENELSVLRNANISGQRNVSQAQISLTEEEISALEEQLRVTEQTIRTSFLDVGDRGLKELREALKGIRANIKDVESAAGGFRVELGFLADTIDKRVNTSLLRFELGIQGSRAPLEQELALLDMRISGLRGLSESTDKYLPILERLIALRNELAKSLEGGEDDAARIAAARADREAQAVRDIRLLRAENESDERARLESVKQARTQNLEERIQELKEKGEEEALTESEIRLEKLRIEKEYNDGINQLRDESLKREQDRKKAELELIKEQANARRQALMQGLSDVGALLNAAFGQDKKTAIASAVVSAYASAQEAYENALKGGFPPPVAKISAVAAFGASMARVQKMKSIQPGSSGGGSGDSGGTSGVSVSDASMSDRFGAQGTRQRQAALRGGLLRGSAAMGEPGYIPGGGGASRSPMSFRVGLGISGGELTAFINEEGSTQINNRSLQASEVA